MSVMTLKFVDKDGETAWPELNRDNITHLGNDAPPVQVVCLDAGMTSGLPSLALRVDLPDGKTVIAETSARLWVSIAKAIEARYPNLLD